MATHSFPVPTFIAHIHMLAGSYIRGTISKYQNGMPLVARKAFKVVSTLKGVYGYQQFCLKLEEGAGYLKAMFSTKVLIEGLGLACIFNV